MKTKVLVGAYRNMVLLFVMFTMVLTACAPSAPWPVATDLCQQEQCLELARDSVKMVLQSTVSNDGKFMFALRGLEDPNKIVTVAEVGRGYGVVGIDLAKKAAQPVCGTWMNCDNLAGLAKVSINSGKWTMAGQKEVAPLIGEGGSLAAWLVYAISHTEFTIIGVMVFSPGTTNDVLLEIIGGQTDG